MYRVFCYDLINNDLECHLFNSFDNCDSYIYRKRAEGYICLVLDITDGHLIDW